MYFLTSDLMFPEMVVSELQCSRMYIIPLGLAGINFLIAVPASDPCKSRSFSSLPSSRDQNFDPGTEPPCRPRPRLIPKPTRVPRSFPFLESAVFILFFNFNINLTNL
jgi:hypothetical protein